MSWHFSYQTLKSNTKQLNKQARFFTEDKSTYKILFNFINIVVLRVHVTTCD